MTPIPKRPRPWFAGWIAPWSILSVSMLVLLTARPAPALFIAPTVEFTSRLINGGLVWVGGTGSTFLDVRAQPPFLEDRAILQFTAPTEASANPIYLTFDLFNGDRLNDFLGPGPHYGTILVYGFAGDGTANVQDYFQTAHLLVSFGDADLPLGYLNRVPVSLDVTGWYNAGVDQVASLGFLLVADMPFPPGPRYYLLDGAPYWGGIWRGDHPEGRIGMNTEPLSVLPDPPPPPIPEPSTLLLLATGLVGLGGLTWMRHHRR